MRSEAAIQQMAQLTASQNGDRLWRNNVGAFVDDRGVPIRYGLANESTKMNQNIKSSDLIGITSVRITADMVGQSIGVFTAYECKREAWKYSGTQREKAQKAFIDLVLSMGGKAGFINNV